MAGKKKVEKETSTWISEVEKYSRQIWLAGLGAYSKVSKDGEKLFDGLVKDGEKAEKQAKAEVDKQVGVVKHTVDSAKSRVEEVKDKAMGKWSELEDAFDKRLNSAISRLGVPSRNEVKDLHGNIIYSEVELRPQVYYVDKENIMMGLRDGIKLMNEGEKVTFVFPSHMGYGYHGDNDKIGTNEPLVCTVTLTDIKPETQSKDN